jgi:glycosyltransferase involved in cell wall biosynthesis
MKILNSVYGDSTGGRWGAALKTARLLAEKGHSVTLLIDPVDLPNVPVDFVGPGLDVVTMRNSGHYDLIASWRAARLIRARGIDAVIAHSGRAIHMLKRAVPRTVPVIAFNHSHNIKRTLEADAFFCITPYMKQIVDRATGGVKPSFVISNAVSIPEDDRLIDGQHSEFTVGAIARMVPNKGLTHLVEALGLLRVRGISFRAILAGEGEPAERDALESRARALGIDGRVDFPGWIRGGEKDNFFRRVDVVCFTSVSDVQPLVILEAFAWGKALIGTDIPGPASCYRDEDTALVVPPANADALAQALQRLAADSALRLRLGSRARDYAKRNFADEVIAASLDARLCEIVAAFSSRQSGVGK